MAFLQVLWVDPYRGLKTLRHDLTLDRGVSFQAASRKLEHEQGADELSGFMRSRHASLCRRRMSCIYCYPFPLPCITCMRWFSAVHISNSMGESPHAGHTCQVETADQSAAIQDF